MSPWPCSWCLPALCIVKAGDGERHKLQTPVGFTHCRDPVSSINQNKIVYRSDKIDLRYFHAPSVCTE